MPGRIIQGMKKVQTNNPVFMLDEIDKLGADFRGDPASALLEVLDPQQNHAFTDHYLEVEYDLSNVMFIATANTSYSIPEPLLDRMEVLHLPGYVESEKEKIAEHFLTPRQIKENGLTNKHIQFKIQSIPTIVNEYTREAGVRNLEREIGNICRKVARKVVTGYDKKIIVGPKKVRELLGSRKYYPEKIHKKDNVGIATGLAWTPAGGAILFIEAVKMPGKEQVILTGQLGDVMKESAKIAHSWIRANAKSVGIKLSDLEKKDIHIHIPAGATPKDGPSAGVTLLTSLVSLISKIPVNREIAMTGEISMTGNVLPVGGIREKVVAAHSAGIKTILLPKMNKQDLEKVPEEVKNGLKFHLVERVSQVLNLALVKQKGETIAHNLG